MIYFSPPETLFGVAPFASNTFEELEEKIVDHTPVKVSLELVCMYAVRVELVCSEGGACV